MDTDSIEKACMADLGRQRQDELPLSDKERKGPSFAPSRRNGTGHIAPELKKGLETKWSVQINDEESEQMKGLAVEDSRPWAKKIAQDFINRNQLFTAPPRIRQESTGHKRAKGNNSHKAHAASLGGLIPVGGSVRHFSASKSIETPLSKLQVRSISDSVPATKSNTNECKLQMLRPTQKSTMTSPTPSPAAPPGQSPGSHKPVTVSLPIRTPKPHDLEHIVLGGICKLLSPKDQSVISVISYIIKVQKNTDEGYLILYREGKEDRIHNVLELIAPDTRGDCCRVCSKAEKNGFAYILQFPNVPDAHKFKIYLESLQEAAAREADLEQNKAKSSTTSVQAAQKRPVPLSTTYSVIDSPSLATLETTNPVRSAVSTLPSTVPTPPKQANTEGAAGSMELVDLEPTSSSTIASRELIIEDAAEKLVELIDKILPKAAAAGLLLSDDIVADIEETAIEDWLTRGFLQSETDDMKADLLELLRILVRIKRKAESRRQAQPVIQSLRDFNREPESNRITYNASELEMLNVTQHQEQLRSKRIQYTASELEGLRGVRVAAPAALAKNIITPRRAPKITSPTTAAVANVSKHKDWLGEKPGSVTYLESTGKTTPVHSPHRANNDASASHEDQSPPGGLDTSR